MESSFSSQLFTSQPSEQSSLSRLRDKLKSIVSLKSPRTAKAETDFDWQFYLSYYPDLSDLTTYEEAYEHWVIFGQFEARFPNQDALEQHFDSRRAELPECFNVRQYLALNPDLAESMSEDQYYEYRIIEHYLEHGQLEGRPYLKEDSDEANRGSGEDSSWSNAESDFDWQFYLEFNDDLHLFTTFAEAHEHWLLFGQPEGRIATEQAMHQFMEQRQSDLPADFDHETYLLLNPDLQRIAGHPYAKQKATEHFWRYGQQEGRVYRLPEPNLQTDPLDLKRHPLQFTTAQEKCREPDKLLAESTSELLHQQQKYSVNCQNTQNLRLIAFYLPQFHPIPENDCWWGKGFTEWTNVSKAHPLFDGHYQPHLPADLGFYDLRLPEVREAQAELARQYGIYGFCYYYYWFAGKRLLHRPLDEMLLSKKPDFPFCLCWANENWTRRWDGAEHEVLIAQEHSPENNQAFAESLIPFLQDERYIRVNGKPLLLVYRIDALPEPARAIQQWRQVFQQHGIGEVHICAAMTFGLNSDPTAFGFDAGVQFPPHGTAANVFAAADLGVANFTGNLYDYRDVVTNALSTPMPQDYDLYLGTMPSWDNTARKQKAANVFLHSDPATYRLWLRGNIEKTEARHRGDHKLVFINAWNEWAEGAHLEPDQKYGHRYLEATCSALREMHDTQTTLNMLRYVPIESAAQLGRLIDDLQERIAAEERSLLAMTQLAQKLTGTVMTVAQVEREVSNSHLLVFNLESPQVGGQADNTKMLPLVGWILHEKIQPVRVEISSGNRIIAATSVNLHRRDVQQSYPHYRTTGCGFQLAIRVSDILNSELQLHVVLEDASRFRFCCVRFASEKQPIPLPIALQKQLQWDETYRDQVKAQLKLLQTLPLVDNYSRLLDEIEYAVNNREQVSTELSNFLRLGSVSDFF